MSRYRSSRRPRPDTDFDPFLQDFRGVKRTFVGLAVFGVILNFFFWGGLITLALVLLHHYRVI